MLMRKCLLAMLILMLVILMLILMLDNLNTGYADTDADLCIRIMSLCCSSKVCKSNLTLSSLELKSPNYERLRPIRGLQFTLTYTVFIVKYQSHDVVDTLYTSICSSLISPYVHFLFIPF